MAGRVVVVMKGYPRLSETFIAGELKALEDHGLVLDIVAMRRPGDAKRHPVHDDIKARVSYLPEYLHWEPLRVLRGVMKAAQLPGFRTALAALVADLRRDDMRDRLRRFGQGCVLAAEMPDDAHWLYVHFIHTPASVTRYASLMTGLPWSCSAHAKDIWTSADWDLADKLGAAQWTTTCTGVGHEKLARLAAGRRPVHLVYHGIDLKRFAAPAGPGSARDGSDAADPVRLLAVGRAVPKKGLDVLLSALSLLPHDLAWRLVHIGGGDARPALQRQAASLGIGDRITWRGAEDQPAVLAAYRDADLFALPCRVTDSGDRDGIPNVLVEAQSQGVACVSTTAGGVPELVIDGETGVLVPPDDTGALAQALARLIQDPALRERLGQAGQLRVRRHFDAATSGPTLAEIFTTSLAGRTPGPATRSAA